MTDFSFDLDDQAAQRELGDGRAIWLIPQLFGLYQLAIGPINAEVYSDSWQYQDAYAAVIAFVTWLPDQQAEPDGWYRHPASGRRRPHGDPAQEYVSP